MNDEVLEVNGIEVAGKSLDQVIFIMVAFIMLLIAIKIFIFLRRTKVDIPGDGHDGRQLQQPDCDCEACESAHIDGAAAGQLLAQLCHVLTLHAELVHPERDG